jgi:ABC-type lipoprotein export system ATPase subunit
MQTQIDYSIVARDFPLIYNLNIVENISLIKEVHEHMPRVLAQKVANEFLEKIDLQHISLLYAQQCSSVEIFYVMLIRAIMTKENKIIIKIAHAMIDTFENLNIVLEVIEKLNIEKKILIVDLQANETYYKGTPCNMIKQD